MFHAARHDDELAWVHNFFVIPEFHPQLALDHQEHFILVVVVMPHEFTNELNSLDVAIVHFTQNFRTPHFVELRKLLRDVDGVH